MSGVTGRGLFMQLNNVLTKSAAPDSELKGRRANAHIHIRANSGAAIDSGPFLLD